MKIYGGLFYLGYKLGNHYLLQISLKNWLWILVVTPALVAVLRRLSPRAGLRDEAWVYAALLSLLALLMLIGVEWARRKGYAVFESASWGPGTRNDVSSDRSNPPLKVDEQITGWACGSFGVGGNRKYLVNAQARFSFVRTREHVVVALVKQTRFLLLARSLRKETGWWYVFFRPEHVREVRQGYLSCAFKTRAGVAVSYQPKDQPGQTRTVYLAFADVNTALRVIADLRLDVSPHAFVAHEDA